MSSESGKRPSALVRAFRVLWGVEDSPRLRPVLSVTLLYNLAFSTFWSYVGIWAVFALGARPSQVGVMFLFSASTSAVANFAGGWLSDRLGRKPPIVFGLLGQSAAVAGLVFVGRNIPLGFAIVTLAGVLAAPARSSTTAIVADLTEPSEREAAYASVRVVNNLGAVLGPPIGGLLLIASDFRAFLFGVGAIGLVAAVIAYRFLPNPRVAAEATSSSGRRLVLRDLAFMLIVLSTLAGFVVYVAYETVLPIAMVSSYGLTPAAWGFLAVINPVMVTLFQRRLTLRVADVPAGAKLIVALPLMGFPFLLLLVNSSIPMIVLVIILFVIGEMLWSPTAQALATRLAPLAQRGAYLGVYSASTTIAWMVAPLVALQLREIGGDPAMWVFFAIAAVVGATTGYVAARAAAGRVPEDESVPARTS
jgi:predicted MFS family arabinose efflux permease